MFLAPEWRKGQVRLCKAAVSSFPGNAVLSCPTVRRCSSWDLPQQFPALRVCVCVCVISCSWEEGNASPRLASGKHEFSLGSCFVFIYRCCVNCTSGLASPMATELPPWPKSALLTSLQVPPNLSFHLPSRSFLPSSPSPCRHVFIWKCLCPRRHLLFRVDVLSAQNSRFHGNHTNALVAPTVPSWRIQPPPPSHSTSTSPEYNKVIQPAADSLSTFYVADSLPPWTP